MTECNVKNRTIFNDDNLGVLNGINSECIDLIYLDPPFNKNKKFAAPIGSSAEGAEFSDIFRQEDVKDEWLVTIEEDEPELYKYLNGIKGVGKPYNFAYLAYMAIRLIECRRVLKNTGSIYLHCDPTMSHYLKTLMDCIFGEDNFKNDLIWQYGGSARGAKAIARHFAKNHDNLFYYVKHAKSALHNPIYRARRWPVGNLPSHIKTGGGGGAISRLLHAAITRTKAFSDFGQRVAFTKQNTGASASNTIWSWKGITCWNRRGKAASGAFPI